jgi:class 3 adenylate cyclase/tetratricopeptide (TPR) repeat protein
VRCPACQHENPAGSRFCIACGGALALTCPSCRTVLPAGSRFCSRCGARVDGATETQARFASPAAYTPRHLAERILTSRAALEGERKQVTVLFADVKGSMDLLADRDPEEARQLLDPVLEHMMEAVHRYEGTVNQVMGDGIMALFGVPLAHEDHAVRGCYAALRMQQTVRDYGERVHRTRGIPIQIRVGVNSGEVVVRSVGSDLRVDYTVIGGTTHLAARMEQMAMPGSILTTAKTLGLAEGFVVSRPLGERPVKGLGAPLLIYEVVGAHRVRSRLHVGAARGLSRFVGREKELAVLEQALTRARGGAGGVVAVVGDPGVGKSRLIWELTHSDRTRGCLVVEATALSYGREISFLPVKDLLRAYFHIDEQDDQAVTRRKVAGALEALGPSVEPDAPAVLALLDLPGDPAWDQLGALQRRRQTLEGLKRLLLRESQEQPLVLVFEDLHWIDSETQAFLDGLVDALPTARILLLTSFRPDYRHRWGSRGYYSQVTMEPLPPERVEELLDGLLGAAAELDPLRQRLIERTEANPFFLEECVRSLAETGVLVGVAGRYRLGRRLEGIHIPDSVQAVLAARIDRLPPEERHLLQTASVVGRDVPLRILQAIAAMPVEHVRAALASLQSAEVLYETSLFPEVGYTFRHALTHEVAYASVLHERRRALHAAIVRAVEEMYAGRLAEQVDQLAYHALRGGLWDKAVEYARQAGARAAARWAHEEAAALYEGALLALGHLPTSRERIEQAIDIRLDMRNSLMPVCQFDRVLGHLQEAQALAETMGDRHRLGWIAGYTSACVWAIGDNPRALELVERTRTIASEIGDTALLIYANLALSWTHHSLGNYEAGIASSTAALSMLEQQPRPQPLGIPSAPAVIARTWLALCLAERGDFPAAATQGERGLELAEAIGEPWSLASAHLGLGMVELRRGHLEAAAGLLARGLEVCRRFDIQVWVSPLSAALGYAHAQSGRPLEALTVLTQSLDRARQTGLKFFHSLAITWLSEAHFLAEQARDAERVARDALALSQAQSEAGCTAYAARALAEIAAHRDEPDLDAAAARYQEVLSLARARAMRPLVARCHLELGRLQARRHRRAEAMADLATAVAMFRELGMTRWAERAEMIARDLESALPLG